jgi:preprotein translocase subunit SecE
MKQRATAGKTGSGQRLNFFSDTISELKKVTWLSRREVIYLSCVVLLVTVAVGAFLGLLDFGFTQLISWGFLP